MWGQWEKIPTPYFSETGQVQAFDNQLFCHTRDGIYRSKNAGQSWELIVKGLCCNGYYHFLNINPATKHYYFVNEEDGQIQISQDGGNTWQNWGQMPVSTPFFERQRGLFFYDNKVYVFQQNYLAIRENGGPLNGWRPLLNLSVSLFPMGDEVRFVPGHGPTSTFGQERLTNPFVGDAAVARRR